MDSERMNKLENNLFTTMLLELAVGIFMIIYNEDSLDFAIRILGIAAASYGIVTLLTWVVKPRRSNGIQVVVTAVFGIVAGAALIFLTESVRGVTTIVAGIFAALLGIIKLPSAFSLKKNGFRNWWIMIIPIALMAAGGVVIGLKPYSSDSVTSILLGTVLIIGCAADIFGIGGTARAADSAAPKKPLDDSSDT